MQSPNEAFTRGSSRKRSRTTAANEAAASHASACETSACSHGQGLSFVRNHALQPLLHGAQR